MDAQPRITLQEELNRIAVATRKLDIPRDQIHHLVRAEVRVGDD